MQCVVCKLVSNTNDNFCVGCGTQLWLHCSTCGHREPVLAKHCSQCGNALPNPRQNQAPISYTPHEIASKINNSAVAAEGRKLVTVLFADMVGSTELIAGLDPENARDLLDQTRAVMLDAIHAERGFVVALQGDGVMALFGAPVAQEHHALRACDAALSIHRGVKKLSNVRVRVGINTGEVVVRAIRNDLSLEYNAVGSTVHLASRMEKMAAPEETYLTENTLSLVQGFVEVASLHSTSIRGFDQKITVCSLVGRNETGSRWEVALQQRELCRFVGRNREIAALNDALSAVGRGNGQLVRVLGEAGVGKSRLIHEFLEISGRGVETTVIGGQRETKTTPYKPIAQMIRRWARMSEDDELNRASLSAALNHSGCTFTPDWEAIEAILGSPSKMQQEWDELDSHIRRKRILEAVKNLVFTKASLDPLILIVEDAHWLDWGTAAVINQISLALDDRKILVIVTARPGSQMVWDAGIEATTLLLSALGRVSSEKLLQSLIGEDSSLIGLKWRLLKRSEGIPMYFEQVIEALVEEAVLIGQPGAYRLAGMTREIRIPESIQSVVAARIDRLEPDDKKFLQMAAVVGREFPLDLMRKVFHMHEDEIARKITALNATGFLDSIITIGGQHRGRFRHALFQEVVYSELLKRERQTLHEKVVLFVEENDLSSDADTEMLALQAFFACLWSKAAEYACAAGDKARYHSSYHEASYFYDIAMEARKNLGESVSNKLKMAQIYIALSTTYPPTGQLNEGYEALESAEKLYQSLGELDKHLEIGVYKTAYFSVRGDLKQALYTGENIVSRARKQNRPDFIVAAKIYLAEAALFAGDFRRAISLIEPHLAEIRGALRLRRIGTTATLSVDGLGLLAMSYALIGQFEEALAVGAEAVKIADEETRRPFDQGLAHFFFGFARTHRGLFDEAMGSLERAVIACEEGNLIMLKPWLDGLIAFSHARCGRVDLARPMFENSVKQANQLELVVFEAMALGGLAVTVFLEGNLDEAEDLARQALKLAEVHGYRSIDMWENRLLGLISAARSNESSMTTELFFRRSIQIGEELGMRPDIALAELFLGSYFLDSQRPKEALQELNKSEILLREMGMTFWLPHIKDAKENIRKEIGNTLSQTSIA